MSLRGFQFAVPRSDILVWLDAGDRRTLDVDPNGLVLAWRDKGPAGRHSNSISATGVSYVASSINGRPAIQFDASVSSFVRGPLVYTGAEVHGFCVFRVNPWSDNSRIFSMGTLGANDWDNTNAVIVLSTLGNQTGFITNRANNLTTSTPITTGVNYLAEGSATAADMYQSINGNPIQQGFGGYSFSNLNTSIYSIGRTTNVGGVLDGVIGEIIVFSRRLSVAERVSVETYLARKWGLTGSLVAAHPAAGMPAFGSAGSAGNQLIPRPFWRQFALPAAPVLWIDAARDTRTGTFSSLIDYSATNYSINVVDGGNIGTITKNGLPAYALGAKRASISNFTWGNPFTIMMAYEKPDTAGGFLFSLGVSSYINHVFTANWSLAYLNGSFAYGDYQEGNSTTNTAGPSIDNAGWNIATFSFAAGGTNFTNYRINGSDRRAVGNTSAISGNNTNTLWINGNWANAFEQVNLGELLFFNQDLTRQQVLDIESYLIQKWGLQSNVSAAAPHFTAPAGRPTVAGPLPINRGLRQRLTPSAFGTCQVWLDAADTTALSATGSTVTGWADKSRNRYSITSGSGGSNRPSVASSSLNGRQTVRFDGLTTAQFLDIPAFDFGTSQRTAFFVIRNTAGATGAASSPHWFWPNTGNVTPNGLAIVGWFFSDNRNVNFQTSFGAARNTWLIVCHRFGFGTAGLDEFYVNGAFGASTIKSNGGTSYLNATAGYRLGWLSNNDLVSDYRFDGNIAEVMLFNNALTDAQRNTMEGYLAHKWGLAGNLPQTHPFFFGPPVSVMPEPPTLAGSAATDNGSWQSTPWNAAPFSMTGVPDLNARFIWNSANSGISASANVWINFSSVFFMPTAGTVDIFITIDNEGYLFLNNSLVDLFAIGWPVPIQRSVALPAGWVTIRMRCRNTAAGPAGLLIAVRFNGNIICRTDSSWRVT